jgi:hypothetical protein
MKYLEGFSSDSSSSEDDLPLVGWRKTDFDPNLTPFTEDSVPVDGNFQNILITATPVDYFLCIFDNSLIAEIAFQTNLYAT